MMEAVRLGYINVTTSTTTDPVVVVVVDGENANLVREENYDVPEDNDTRRDREDESEEERNVRP